MPTIAVNDIDICYESFGPDDAPPLLLVMGLGAQMTLWSRRASFPSCSNAGSG